MSLLVLRIQLLVEGLVVLEAPEDSDESLGLDGQVGLVAVVVVESLQNRTGG